MKALKQIARKDIASKLNYKKPISNTLDDKIAMF